MLVELDVLLTRYALSILVAGVQVLMQEASFQDQKSCLPLQSFGMKKRG